MDGGWGMWGGGGRACLYLDVYGEAGVKISYVECVCAMSLDEIRMDLYGFVNLYGRYVRRVP